MKYIYFIGANDQETEAQRQGIKDYLSQRGTLFSDCTVLTPEYSYSDPGYNAGILEIMNRLKDGDILYTWDFSVLGKSLEQLHENILIGADNGAVMVQCLDSTIAGNDCPENMAFINAIAVASRIELKISKIQRVAKYSKKENGVPIIPNYDKKTKFDPTFQADPSEILVRRYNEKSVVIYGNTRIIKDELKNLGAKYNARINNGSPGWVFSVRKLDDLKKILTIHKHQITPDCYLSKKEYNEVNEMQ